jgi:hypothetical protein
VVHTINENVVAQVDKLCGGSVCTASTGPGEDDTSALADEAVAMLEFDDPRAAQRRRDPTLVVPHCVCTASNLPARTPW